MVQLANGDIAKGIVTDSRRGQGKINSNGADLELPLDNVDWIHFASAARPPAEEQVEFRLRLSDGSTLTVRSAAGSPAPKSASPCRPRTARKVPLERRQRHRAAQRPGELALQPPARAGRAAPVLPGPARPPWPTRMDASVLDARDGTPLPIRFAGRTYSARHRRALLLPRRLPRSTASTRRSAPSTPSPPTRTRAAPT